MTTQPSRRTSRNRQLEDFTGPTGTSTFGQPNIASNIAINHESVPEHDVTFRAANISWSSAGSSTFFQSNWAPVGSGFNLSSYQDLDIRVDRIEDTVLNSSGDTTFEVALVTSTGALSTSTFITNYGNRLDGPRSGPFNFHTMLQTVRIPLTDFGVSLTSIRGVRLTFSFNPSGHVYVGSIRAATITTPPVPLMAPVITPVASSLMAPAVPTASAQVSSAVMPGSVPEPAPAGAAAPLPGPQLVTSGNAVTSLRSTPDGASVQVAVSSPVMFDARGQLLTLRIGSVESKLSAYPSGDLRSAVFTLPRADWARDSGAGLPDQGPPEPPPHPTSTRCGDGIRDPVTEECDEAAAGTADPCTADCRVRAVSVVQAMQLGTAPHVAGGSDSGFAIVYAGPDASPAVQLQLYGESGARLGAPLDVAGDYAPVPAANAAVAALPGGAYAVAWTDGMDGPPEVRLRLVDGRTLRAARLAHEDAAGLHADPDLIWAGDRLIVAFTDLLDVTYRAFTADLVPLGPEAPLAATAAIESGVALARFGSGWAGAVRSSSDALESIVIRSGALTWSTPPAPPGPTGDRPALAALDDAHLLVLFSVGADPDGTGTADVGRLFWAVADTVAPGPLAVRALDAGAAPPSSVSQRRPTATRAGDGVYLGWTETDGAGAGAEQAYLAVVASEAGAGFAIGAPMALPRGANAAGWRRNLHLASSTLFPAGAVISTWESASDGSSLAAVDLVLDFRPSPFVFLD